MKIKILTCVLIVSVCVNIMVAVIPMVNDQYIVTKSEMFRYVFILLECYKDKGSLPFELPEDNIHEVSSLERNEVEYKRLDDDKAVMRARIDNRFSFATLYIGCDINFKGEGGTDHRRGW